jgi:putative nucleotidyltransferase with HDIG domain
MTKSPPSPRSEIRAATRIERGLAERAGFWSRLLGYPLLWALLTIVACSWFLMARPDDNLPRWQQGELAAYDVMVPRDLTVPDEAATEAVREEARARVLPVYDFEPRLRIDLVEDLRVVFKACRTQMEEGSLELPEILAEVSASSEHDLLIEPPMIRILTAAECGNELELALFEVASQLYQERIADDRRILEKSGEGGLTIRNLLDGSEQEVALDELSGVIDYRSGLEPALRSRLLAQDAVHRRWISSTVQFLESNLAPNLSFNRAETAERKREAAEQVAPRSQVFRRGQILIRRGDTVSASVEQTLRRLNQQGQELTAWTSSIGTVLLVALMTLGWWQILKRLGSLAEGRDRLSMVLILMTIFVALNRLALFVANAVAQHSQGAYLSTVESYQWGIPYAAGAIAVLMLLGTQAALIFALFEGVAAGLMLGGDFGAAVYALASCMVAALIARQLKDRTVFTRMGAVIGVANVVLLLIILLYRGQPVPAGNIALSAVSAFIGGPLAVGVTSFLLPLFEGFFGITTDIRLLELSNQNLPLLKRLSLEAPGTYQHSLAVGNLAEAGADAVGANSLLLRVCAYYHDIGKLVKPGYFVENQRGSNPHDPLSPSMSTLVIQSHVKEGLEMARKVKLPLPVRQAIATHHGTKLIRYFYDKAVKQQDPELGEVRKSDYRYAGPRPHSKELGILLLADAVEAAARTLDSPSPAKMQNMIKRIFSDALEDGQLDRSELTFLELDKIASAFLWVLTNMYHHRIEYPGFDFNRRQDKRDSGSVQLGPKAVTSDG